MQVGFRIGGADTHLAHGDDVLGPEIGADLAAGDGGSSAYFGVGDCIRGNIGGSYRVRGDVVRGNRACCDVVGGDGPVIDIAPGPAGHGLRASIRDSQVGPGLRDGGGPGAAVCHRDYPGYPGGVAGDVALHAGAGDQAGDLCGRNCPNNLRRSNISRYLRTAHGLDIIVGDGVALPGAGDDVAAGIHGEGAAGAAGLRLLLVNAAHGQSGVGVGGADTDVAGLIVHHESRAVGSLYVQKPLRVFRPDTDVAHRREQVVTLLGGWSAFAGHVQIFAAVVLQFAVPVLHPHTEHEPPGSRQPLKHHALIAADTGVGFILRILRLDVVLPVFGVPAFNGVVVDHEGQRNGSIARPAELNRHGYGVAARGGLATAGIIDLGYVHHSRRPFPHRGAQVDKRSVYRVLSAFRDLDRVRNETFFDQVVLEFHCDGTGLDPIHPVLPQAVSDGKVLSAALVLHHHHDLLEGFLVLGAHRAGDGPAGKRGEIHRIQSGQVRRGDGYRRRVVGALVTRVNEAHLVASHRDLVQDERTVVVGEPDVVGALDHHEGACIAKRRSALQQAVARETAGGGQGQVDHGGRQRRYRATPLGFQPAPGRFDVVSARVQTGKQVDALGVGDGGVGAFCGSGSGLDRPGKLCLASGPRCQDLRLLAAHAVLVDLAGQNQDAGTV